MNAGNVTDRGQAHVLVDRLDDGQVAALVGLLQFMLSDPVSRALAAAPPDDEPESAEEREAVAEARGTYGTDGRTVSQQNLLREFGLA